MRQSRSLVRFPASPRPFTTPLKGVGVALCMILLATTMAAGPSIAAAQTSPDEAREIVRHVDDLLRGESSRGMVRMEVVTERWTRTMEMEMWSLGQDYSLVRVLSPSREAGTATLKVERDIWNYLPRVDRTIKVPGSGMGGSWMGSHFTYDDLVRESSMVDDYEIEVSFEGERAGTELWEFTLVPQPEAPVVWSRLELDVRTDDRMPLEARYFDDRGELARTMSFSEFRTMDGRLVPTRLSMHPEDKPGERTTLLYQELEFDTGLTSSFFSLQRLREGP
ncbi:MAG: outer membrane lipoprotein-sorting protein [Gemmatimonadales bacterium]|nr:MAG: outer membrane lipoprotein-sorting protein [Gemmatimonadales bacterium]